MAIPAALIGSIISGIATTVGNIALSERQKQTYKENQQEMNQYNLPINQVQRLKDAGISPNSLSMGSNGMTVSGNTSESMNPYTTPDLRDPMSMISNSFLSMAQGSTEEQMREIRKQQAAADIANLEANTKKLGLESQYQNIINAFAAAKEHASLVGQFRSNDLALWQTKKVKEEARQLAKYIDEIMPEELAKLVAEKNLTVGQMDLLVEQIANLQADTALKGEQQENIAADTSLKESQKDVADTQAALNVEERGFKAQESFNYQAITDKLLELYQATINKLAQECNLTEQQAFYYLYELGQKYSVRMLGVPLPGAGGIRNNLNANEMQKNIGKKYKVNNPNL